jgi:hypothetical protein
MDFRDLNHAFPKDNFPTPFIDQIIDDCADPKAFSFMVSFSGYNLLALCNFPKAVEAVTEATSKTTLSLGSIPPRLREGSL